MNHPDSFSNNDKNAPWNEPEPLECPVCNGEVTQDDDGSDYRCDDEDCSGVIYAPDGDCF